MVIISYAPATMLEKVLVASDPRQYLVLPIFLNFSPSGLYVVFTKLFTQLVLGMN